MQYHAIPQIRDVISKAMFNTTWQYPYSTHVKDRPMAKSIIQFNEANFGMKTSVAFLNVLDGAANKSFDN